MGVMRASRLEDLHLSQERRNSARAAFERMLGPRSRRILGVSKTRYRVERIGNGVIAIHCWLWVRTRGSRGSGQWVTLSHLTGAPLPKRRACEAD